MGVTFSFVMAAETGEALFLSILNTKYVLLIHLDNTPIPVILATVSYLEMVAEQLTKKAGQRGDNVEDVVLQTYLQRIEKHIPYPLA